MKYICLCYDEEAKLKALPTSEMDAIMREVYAYNEELTKQGRLIAVQRLQSVETATTVRVRNGKLSTTDGPFAETKEQLGGFFLIEARDLNEAIQIASKLQGAVWAASRCGRSWSLPGCRQISVPALSNSSNPERLAGGTNSSIPNIGDKPMKTIEPTIAGHKIASREEWLAARIGLLKEEKELTRRSDGLARRRQELPWVPVDKQYRFETDKGSASLADLFRGRSQLLVYHFMFGPEYTAGCATCSTIADGFDGFVAHLANHDVMLSAVSRAPSRSCRRTSGGWGGRFPGHPRTAATSTSTSTSRSPRSNSARDASNTTTSAAATRWMRQHRSRSPSPKTRR